MKKTKRPLRESCPLDVFRVVCSPVDDLVQRRVTWRERSRRKRSQRPLSSSGVRSVAPDEKST